MDNLSIFIIIYCGTIFLLGLIFFIIGLSILNSRKKKEKNCTSKTFGKIVNLIKYNNYSDDVSISGCHPVFEYNIGKLNFIKKSIFVNSHAKYTIGQTVEIYYNPEDYNEYYVPGETIPKKIGKIFTITGVILLIIDILILGFNIFLRQ